ncbi:MAG TPA: cell envelope biogenesis protein TolA, partial [Roseiarcus sp.]|nr:cell envelope biogenesis protein TolA [Roseiarcus sp.]
MSDQSPKSGVVVSGALHGALLVAILIGFSGAPKFDDSAETVPVETVTQDQYNQIMKGERDAKPAKPVENQGQPPVANAPTPPEPPKSEPPPKSEETRDLTP